jgi:hypothetical protein
MIERLSDTMSAIKLPITVKKYSNISNEFITDSDGIDIAMMATNDGEMIITAVNSHDALIARNAELQEALHKLVRVANMLDKGYGEYSSGSPKIALKHAEQLLKKE